MQKVYSYEPLEKVAYYQLSAPLEGARVYLRENISTHQVLEPDDSGQEVQTATYYSADENTFVTSLTKEEVEADFNALWVQAETSGKTLEERVNELDRLLGAVIDELLGVNKA